MSMKNSNDATGNQTHNLPTCSAVPQPTVLLCTPLCQVEWWNHKTSFNLLYNWVQIIIRTGKWKEMHVYSTWQMVIKFGGFRCIKWKGQKCITGIRNISEEYAIPPSSFPWMYITHFRQLCRNSKSVVHPVVQSSSCLHRVYTPAQQADMPPCHWLHHHRSAHKKPYT